MNPEISSKPSSPIFSFILLFFVLVDLSRSLSVDWYSNCKSEFTCGYISGLGYPFWGDNRGNHCGYPELELKCENNIPRIVLGGVTYRALQFTEDLQVLMIAREDYFDGICPQNFANITLDSKLCELSDSGYTNCTLVYGCPNPPGNGNGYGYGNTSSRPSANFTCSISKAESETGYIIPPGVKIPTSCFASEIVPVSQLALSGFGTDFTTVDSLLQRGFEVKLKVDTQACINCAQSNGACGYDPLVNKTVCYCANQTSVSTTCPPTQSAPAPQQEGTATASPGNKKGHRSLVIVTGAVIGGLILTIIIFFLIKKQQSFSKGYSGHQNIEAFIRQYGSLAPQRYKYSEVKKMTNSFKNKLGQGGYGTVYKGMLHNGCSVAVKILNTSRGNGEEFINEVASISRTSHVNIVTLLGYCFQGKRRALIYEFMANGSLDKFIHDGTISSPHAFLGWEKLYQIAIGIARGLEYLHRGCNTRILHFDIKPHNILLDEEFQPKISDFGLAKLCLKKESIVSMMIARGTIGYIAPEVCNRNFGGVSPKSDVYSYGMMVLEIIGLTKKTNVDVDGSNQLYFPNWIYERLQLSQDLEVYDNITSEESEILRKMTLIGLWCIQMNPSERPSMSKVIEMLEGSVEVLKIPPKPFFSSPRRVIEGLYSTSSLFIEE